MRAYTGCFRAAAFFFLCFSVVSFAGEPAPGTGEHTPGQILQRTARVADWQLAHLDTAHVPTQPDDQMSPRGWVFAVFDTGLTALADAWGDETYARAVVAQGTRQKWKLEVRPFHADDYAIGQSWIWAWRRSRDPQRIAALKARLDEIIRIHPDNALDYGTNPPPFVESACQKRWCWADALFMGAPVFAAMSRATSDPKYWRYADREFWHTVDFLYDRQEKLFYRDSRYFVRRDGTGGKIFWSRGNGWVYAALVRMMELMPADAANRARYETLFREMSARLIALQKPDGYWPVSLTAASAGTPPETSGTAFFSYGLAWGVRTGLLGDEAYRRAAWRGWHALSRAVQPDGRLGWVQGIGVGPDAVRATDSAAFGTGAFLLAGTEIYRLAQRQRLALTMRQSRVGEGYAASAVNAVSMARHAVFSAGKFQFVAFYGPAKDGRVPVRIARRGRPDGSWQIADTPFSVPDEYSNGGARDDHNIIAAAADEKGRLHLSWGMHNLPLNYAVSVRPVTEGFAGRMSFERRKMIGRDENEVTYPEFFSAPDGALMFAWRNGGAGGGSGNGNEYLNRYDVAHGRWVRVASPMVDGMSTGMNAYLNAFAFDGKGGLHASWTIRETPVWQSNHDVYAVRSDDGGRSWTADDGTPLGRTMTRASADAHARILSLPQDSSLINQTGMAATADGSPLIASWWAPRAASGDHTRQYMLLRKTGASWHLSQLTHRASGESFDDGSAHVREMGRPVVLVDKAGRILVVTRFSDAGMPVTDKSNRIRIFWSADGKFWSSLVLPTVNPGTMEPVVDMALWQRENRLALYFQPLGLKKAASPVSVITWDEAAWFGP